MRVVQRKRDRKSGLFSVAIGDTYLLEETAEAPPVADKARLFRGSGTIGGGEAPGNRYAATVSRRELFKEKETAKAVSFR